MKRKKTTRFFAVPVYAFFAGWMFVLFMAGCATVPESHLTAVYLSDLCAQYHIQWQWDPVSQTVSLRKSGSSAKGLVGSNVVLVDGAQVTLSSAIQRSRNSILVPADFESQVIIRMKGRTPSSLRGPWTVVIDPGHGGKDPGAIGRTGLHEKKVVLDIAKQLREDLERKGFKVIMTRSTDEFITLERRTEITSRAKADLFISIHANSNRSSSARGVEVYTIRDLDYKEKKEEQRLKNLKIMFNALDMDQSNSDAQRIVSEMLYDYKRSESQQAASALSRGLSQGMDTSSRGTKEAGYFVLRNTLIPAILVEVGFLSNSKEERKLASSSYRDQVAEVLAENIANYAGRRWE